MPRTDGHPQRITRLRSQPNVPLRSNRGKVSLPELPRNGGRQPVRVMQNRPRRLKTLRQRIEVVQQRGKLGRSVGGSGSGARPLNLPTDRIEPPINHAQRERRTLRSRIIPRINGLTQLRKPTVIRLLDQRMLCAIKISRSHAQHASHIRHERRTRRRTPLLDLLHQTGGEVRPRREPLLRQPTQLPQPRHPLTDPNTLLHSPTMPRQQPSGAPMCTDLDTDGQGQWSIR